jgi:hypothetical protein
MQIQLHAVLLKKQFALRKKGIKKVLAYIMSTNITDLPYNTPTKSEKTEKAELPVRDIPRETINHVVDPQVTVNYLPQKEPDYIEQQPIQLPQTSKMDKLMDEFRLPIILAVLYFIFQLPLLDSFLLRTLPSVFKEDTMGTAAKSILFGLAYHISMLLIEYLNKP